jgi:hypothetical protein
MTGAVIATDETFKAAWIASLKSKPTLTALLLSPGATEIRETQWQGSDFDYPAVRVAVDFMPSINRCGPDDGDITIEVFSAEKSSKQATHIASVIQQLYHGHPFTSAGIMFNTVIVRKVHKPIRSIYAWMVKIDIFCQGV